MYIIIIIFTLQLAQPVQIIEDEVQTLPPVNVNREILLAEDAQYRFKLRQLRKKMTPPLIETDVELTAEEELAKPNNFKNLPDNTQIIRGASAITEKTVDVLPFAAIMAVVTSYKYTVNTWTEGIVNFVVETAKKLYDNKLEKFQLAPVHIIPKIAIGHQVSCLMHRYYIYTNYYLGTIDSLGTIDCLRVFELVGFF